MATFLLAQSQQNASNSQTQQNHLRGPMCPSAKLSVRCLVCGGSARPGSGFLRETLGRRPGARTNLSLVIISNR